MLIIRWIFKSHVRNGNFGTDGTTTTKAASVRKQLGTKNSKSNEGRQEKNGGVKGRDESAEELVRETGEEPITVGWTRRKDGGWPTTEESGRVTWGGDVGGQCSDGRTVLREMWRRQERKEKDWKKKTIDRGGWKRLSDEAVKKLRAAPRPWEKGRERE